MKRFIKLIQRSFNRVILDPLEAAFILHNREVWKNQDANPTEGEILLEMNDMASSIISYSYLANALAHTHGAAITAYVLRGKKFWSGLRDRKIKRIYRSFNTLSFKYLDLTQRQRHEADRLFQHVYPLLKTKRDVENLTVEGVWIGDLLYDSYLMSYQVPTITIEAQTFQSSLRECLGYYVFWRDYLLSHRVRAIILSHCVYYRYAVLLRLGVQRGVPVYQCNASHLYRLSRERLWAYDDFYDYPELFRQLPPAFQERALKAAEERLQQRFSGEVGVDMQYSSKSAYTKPADKRIISESPRIKVLIATHCFFDSPHPYGVNLFPDFYEWLTFLGGISEETDYDWYLKTHPDFLPGNMAIIGDLVRRFPKITVIPPESSHLQLIKEGINFALTVYGTIGFEYAALGVPVINASLCNPHIRYSFNLHPRTVREYEEVLLNLPRQKLGIDVGQVYEYYYMAFLHPSDNWLFRDFKGFLKEAGGYYEQFGAASYEKFMEEFSGQRHDEIRHSLEAFVDSLAYSLKRSFAGG